MSAHAPRVTGRRIVICDYNALLLSVTGVLRMSGYCVLQAHDSAATEELCLTLPVPSFCRSFSGTSGQITAGRRAPTLGKWPFPNKLSEMPAWATGLWIRRVLVRAQEGQCPPYQRWAFSLGSASGSRPGNTAVAR